MGLLTLSKSEQRKVSLFFTCLGMAMLLWLFFALSNQYDYQIRINVQYTNLPQNKAFHPLQSDTVSLNIKGTGWQLLFSHILNLNSVNVSLQKLSSRNYVTFNEQLNSINKQFNSNQKVVSVSPDTLYFDFSSRTVKKVPVKLAYDIKFKSRFGIASEPVITPAFIVVTGAKDDLEHINYWLSDSLKLSDISSSVFSRVALSKSSKANISIYPTVVDVKVPVDEFTENSLDVPLSLQNNKTYTVKVLPDKVRITFLTALSNFHKNNAETFQANLDFDDWKNFGYEQLHVYLSRIPPYCKIINVQPQTVDFIIKK